MGGDSPSRAKPLVSVLDPPTIIPEVPDDPPEEFEGCCCCCGGGGAVEPPFPDSCWLLGDRELPDDPPVIYPQALLAYWLAVDCTDVAMLDNDSLPVL